MKILRVGYLNVVNSNTVARLNKLTIVLLKSVQFEWGEATRTLVGSVVMKLFISWFLKATRLSVDYSRTDNRPVLPFFSSDLSLNSI